MAGKDINTWKMKRREKYEKPTAVRMSDKDIAGVSGGQMDTGACGEGWLALGSCVYGNNPWSSKCVAGNQAMANCVYGTQN